jgi:hypothetical protein
VISLTTILVVVLIVLLIGALTRSADWGYMPGGVLGLLLIIILVLVLLGRL